MLACSPSAEAPPAEAPAPVAVHVAAVHRGRIASALTVSGETVALTTLRLASPVAGRVTALAVQPGDRLAAGAVAARVLPMENEAVMHGFGVLADAGALAADERPTAQRLSRDIAAHDVALRAPFDAVVAERLHSPGEQVAPADPLLELFDPRSLVVIAQVPIDSGAAVAAGQPVEVRLGGARLAGRVAAVLTAVTPQALTLPVRIALDAPLTPPLLHAAVECRITVAERADAAAGAALRPAGGARGRSADTVMVSADGRAHRRVVQLGLRDDDEVEVVDGLAARRARPDRGRRRLCRRHGPHRAAAGGRPTGGMRSASSANRTAILAITAARRRRLVAGGDHAGVDLPGGRLPPRHPDRAAPATCRSSRP